MLNFKHLIKKSLRPRGQRSFISSIQKENCNILDVGCGKNSIFLKSVKPNSYVCGVDISFFEQTNESKALYDSLIICEAESHRLECKYYNNSYKPPIWWFLGLVQEYISKKRDFIRVGTYDYYGFE